MAAESFKRKLTVILSADVQGYSRLMGEDEEATVLILTAVHVYGEDVDSPVLRKLCQGLVLKPCDELPCVFHAEMVEKEALERIEPLHKAITQ